MSVGAGVHRHIGLVFAEISPVTVMANLEMRIYTAFDGIETTIKWANEEEYLHVRKFLKDAGARVMGISEDNKPTAREFVYVGNKEQIQSLGEFVKSLRQKVDPK
jgi:hypothetical protein